jgi:quercetin dioxygenase-like cupin family protein
VAAAQGAAQVSDGRHFAGQRVQVGMQGLAHQQLQEGEKSMEKNTSVEVISVGSQRSAVGPADWFSGTVRIDPLFAAVPPGRAAGAAVTFEPGARTVWHTHPLGQTLIVTSGVGRVQSWGGPVEEIRPGDVVQIPADVKHWHGAAPTTAMSHIAVQEELDGSAVAWLERVTDAQYEGR